MTDRRRITEQVDLDLSDGRWHCHRCDRDLGDGRRNYKEGCLVYDRDPRTMYPEQLVELLAPDPTWCRYVEFYCPSCGAMLEVEVLPPGHPITHDIELDLDALRRRAAASTAPDAAGS